MGAGWRLCLAAVACASVAGCIVAPGDIEAAAAPPMRLSMFEGCQLTFPDRSPIDCDAVLESAAPSPGGAPDALWACIEEIATREAVMRLHRDVRELAGKGGYGIHYAASAEEGTRSGHVTVGSEVLAFSDLPREFFLALPQPAERELLEVFLYRVEHESRHPALAAARLQLAWTSYGGEPYPIVRLAAEESVYHFSVAMGFRLAGKTSYSPIDVELRGEDFDLTIRSVEEMSLGYEALPSRPTGLAC